jgi:hypothetical protein
MAKKWNNVICRGKYWFWIVTCTTFGEIKPMNCIPADLIIVLIAVWIYQFHKEISK